MKKYLVVIDMQKDFVDGALGTPEALAIVPAVAEKIRTFDGDGIIVTLDTHGDDYPRTLEGKKLPVPHCIAGTAGHALDADVAAALDGTDYVEIEKETFGTFGAAEYLFEDCPDGDMEIEICGVCTDICVVSNALILRAAFPNVKMTVSASLCAGVTPALHEAALAVMKSCQIDVIE